MRGSDHLTSNTIKHWITWLSCTLGISIAAYLIASAVPVFSDLISLVGALFGTFLSLQTMGFMWFYDNWSTRGTTGRSVYWGSSMVWAVFVILAGSFITASGTYGSIVQIVANYRASGGSAAWSCADNSSS